MKKFILFNVALLFMVTLSVAQNGTKQTSTKTVTKVDGAQISFDTETIDYGTIENGSDGNREFKFTNTGKTPLVITNATGSCGCTVPTWPKEAIAPGKSASIKVHYDTNRTGAFNKSITLVSNATNEPTKILHIKGTVNAPKETAY